MHGAKIIKLASLPIGHLSEEAQEARNKDYREYRRYHSRKFSRTATNEDVMQLLLASSDPFINSLRVETKRMKIPLHDDVNALLKH